MPSIPEFFAYITNAAFQRGFPAPLKSGDQANGPKVAPLNPFDLGESFDIPPNTDPPLTNGLVPIWFGGPRSAQQGFPPPLNPTELRPFQNHPIPFGGATYAPIRRYDWGSGANAYDGGRVYSNPIGAGIVITNRFRIFSPLIGQVLRGQIISWNSQTLQPGMGGPTATPIYDPAVLAQLLGPVLAKSVVNGQYIPPALSAGPTQPATVPGA